MKYDLSKLKELPRMTSHDYLQLMHEALESNDKEWFDELAAKKDKQAELEQIARNELGWKGE